MKNILALLGMLVMVSAAAMADTEAYFRRYADVNQVMSRDRLPTLGETRYVAVDRVSSVSRLVFGQTLGFRDSVSKSPVNVDSFALTRAVFTFSRNGAEYAHLINKSMDGSQMNSPGDGSTPDLEVYDIAGNKRSTDGDNVVGTAFTNVAYLHILDQRVPMGGPFGSLQNIGDTYTITRVTEGSFTIGGVTRPFALTSVASVTVVAVPPEPDIVSQTLVGSGMTMLVNDKFYDIVGVEHTTDLMTWLPLAFTAVREGDLLKIAVQLGGPRHFVRLRFTRKSTP